MVIHNPQPHRALLVTLCQQCQSPVHKTFIEVNRPQLLCLVASLNVTINTQFVTPCAMGTEELRIRCLHAIEDVNNPEEHWNVNTRIDTRQTQDLLCLEDIQNTLLMMTRALRHNNTTSIKQRKISAQGYLYVDVITGNHHKSH